MLDIDNRIRDRKTYVLKFDYMNDILFKESFLGKTMDEYLSDLKYFSLELMRYRIFTFASMGHDQRPTIII